MLPVPQEKKVGRPPGKYSDPNYGKFTHWLPLDIQKQFKLLCLREKRAMSKLTEG